MPTPRAVRLLDASLRLLLAPRVRRVRRWAFLVTVPTGYLVGRSIGLGLGEGVVLGALATFLELAALLVVLAAARRLGPERRDALLDLLMHPLARRLVAGEARLLSTLPAAALQRLRPPRGEAFAYHRGTQELGLVLALLPAMAAEGAAVHLLLPADWFWPKVVVGVLHLYGVVMLLSWAVSQRTQPHRLHAGRLELRVGQTHRAGVATAAIASAEVARRRDGARTGLEVTGETARLTVAGRTDVLLRFTEPLRIDRPLGDPVTVTALAVAADDPERLVRAITPSRNAPQLPVAQRRQALQAWWLPADLLGALT